MKYQQPYGITDPNAVYINGDPSIGRKGSVPPAAAFEYPQREIINLITASGQVPADTDLFQVLRSIRDGRLVFVYDTGAVNNVVVTMPGTPLLQYKAGLRLNIFMAHTVTGPTTITIDNLGARPLRRANAAELAAGDISAGMVAAVIDDGTQFQLLNFTGAGGSGEGTTNTYLVDVPFCIDTSTVANVVIAPYVPPIVEKLGMLVEVELANNTTGPTTFKPNALPTRNVVHGDGSPIRAGDGFVGMIWLLAFDGTRYQLLNGTGAGAGVIPPSSGSGKSLTFTDPGYTSKLRRYPTIVGDKRNWTISMFCKRNSLVYDRYWDVAYGIRSNFLWSAGTGNTPYTGSDNNPYASTFPVNRLFWNNAYVTVAGGQSPGGTITGFCAPALVDTNWHHLLWTGGGGQMSCYQDGILVSQGIASGDSAVNDTVQHAIGYSEHFDPYGTDMKVAEIYFIDGLALSWTAFATAIGPKFVPKQYTGVFGTNGSYLNFSDSSGATSTTMGKDWSGRGNDWTPVNCDISMFSSDFPPGT